MKPLKLILDYVQCLLLGASVIAAGIIAAGIVSTGVAVAGIIPGRCVRAVAAGGR